LEDCICDAPCFSLPLQIEKIFEVLNTNPVLTQKEPSQDLNEDQNCETGKERHEVICDRCAGSFPLLPVLINLSLCLIRKLPRTSDLGLKVQQNTWVEPIVPVQPRLDLFGLLSHFLQYHELSFHEVHSARFVACACVEPNK